ncbi:MAG: energy transducer TonB [Saprospiraceae bacterium]|nr:energy transducer TonB [Saprospiraceae bacterium]
MWFVFRALPEKRTTFLFFASEASNSPSNYKKIILMFTKHSFFSIIFILINASNLVAQIEDLTNNSENSTPSVSVDQMPYFIGCANLPDGSIEKRACSNQTLVTFIAKNMILPPKSDIVGTVYVRFEVDENGRVLDPKILRGLSNGHDEAALKVVRALPTWQPAQLAGKSVRATMTLPIKFSRRDESAFSNGFQLTWGFAQTKKVNRTLLKKMLGMPIIVRNEMGVTLTINELSFERERRRKIAEAKSSGSVNEDMAKFVKKLKAGDVLTVTATVQTKGQFYYVDRSFKVE